MSNKDRLIVALDFTSLAPALAVARQLRGVVRTIKIGSALFTAQGPRIVERVRSLGFEVMLDLKFLDIPSTVELSCRAAVHHRVSMLTVHASGSPAMLEAAVRGAREEARRLRTTRPRILGVTVLTSVASDRLSGLRERVVALTKTALQAGCDGIVASGQEAAALRRRFGKRPFIVCPGIRMSHEPSGDQRRISTPREALTKGADAIVVGRSITASRHPRTVARRILEELYGPTT